MMKSPILKKISIKGHEFFLSLHQLMFFLYMHVLKIDREQKLRT